MDNWRSCGKLDVWHTDFAALVDKSCPRQLQDSLQSILSTGREDRQTDREMRAGVTKLHGMGKCERYILRIEN